MRILYYYMSFLWPHNLLLWPLQGRPVELCQTLFHVPLTFCYQLGTMVARLPWTCTLSLPSNSSLFMKPHQLQVMPWRWVFSVSSLPTFLPAGVQEWIFPNCCRNTGGSGPGHYTCGQVAWGSDRSARCQPSRLL